MRHEKNAPSRSGWPMRFPPVRAGFPSTYSSATRTTASVDVQPDPFATAKARA